MQLCQQGTRPSGTPWRQRPGTPAWLASQRTRRVGPRATAAELEAVFGGPMPRAAMPAGEVIDYLAAEAEPGLMAMPSDRFFGWVIGGTLPAALAADWLVSAWDQNSFLVLPHPPRRPSRQQPGGGSWSCWACRKQPTSVSSPAPPWPTSPACPPPAGGSWPTPAGTSTATVPAVNLLAPDTSQAHGGKASYRLDADFRGGGAYVGSWKDLEPLGLPDVEEFRALVRAEDLGRLGVRIVDDTGQCHQASVDLPAGAGDGWREVVLKVRDLVGGEHWGGANDGAWHGPPEGPRPEHRQGLRSRPDADGRATLWIDDLAAVRRDARPADAPLLHDRAGAVPAGVRDADHATSGTPSPGVELQRLRPLRRTRRGRWSSRPTTTPPCRPAAGRAGSNTPGPSSCRPTPRRAVTTSWSGSGIQARRPGGGRRPFRAARACGPPDDACRVGTMEVAADAPLPKLPAPSLNLDGYRLTFDEDFREPLSVSAWGPGTRWIAHTPYAGDFGDAGFADPEKDSRSRSRTASCGSRPGRPAAGGGPACSARSTPRGAASRRSSATSRCGRSSPRARAPGRRSG